MSAPRLVVVAASTPMPTGPAATVASAPILNSLRRMAFTALSFISTSMTCEASPPICRPMEPAPIV